MNEYAMNEYVTNEYVAMNVYAAQEADVDGVVEVVAAVAEPITDRASAAPVSSLPIIKKGETKFRFHTYKVKKSRNVEKENLPPRLHFPFLHYSNNFHHHRNAHLHFHSSSIQSFSYVDQVTEDPQAYA